MPPTEPAPSPWQFDQRGRSPFTDVVTAGADLEPGTILAAYRQGLFPMPNGGQILWWSPRKRGVLRPADMVIHRSLRKSIKHYTVTVDQSFSEVIAACADPTRDGAWIDGPMRTAYERLHELGWAHSVETRDQSGALVGGLYGLALGGLFCGESMFHHRTDASKVALVRLCELLGDDDHRLIDVQWQTPHLASLGVVEISRNAYLSGLDGLLAAPLPPIWRNP